MHRTRHHEDLLDEAMRGLALPSEPPLRTDSALAHAYGRLEKAIKHQTERLEKDASAADNLRSLEHSRAEADTGIELLFLYAMEKSSGVDVAAPASETYRHLCHAVSNPLAAPPSLSHIHWPHLDEPSIKDGRHRQEQRYGATQRRDEKTEQEDPWQFPGVHSLLAEEETFFSELDKRVGALKRQSVLSHAKVHAIGYDPDSNPPGEQCWVDEIRRRAEDPLCTSPWVKP